MVFFSTQPSKARAKTRRVRFALLNALLVLGCESLQYLLLVANVKAHLQKIVGVDAQLMFTERRLGNTSGLRIAKVGMTP